MIESPRAFTSRPSIWLTFLLFLSISACSQTVGERRTGEAAPSGEWTLHRDPMGFSVKYPTEWNIQRDGETGRVTLSGPDQSEIFFWPVFMQHEIELSQAVRTESMLLSRLSRETRWSRPQTVGPSTLRSVASAGKDKRAVALFCWTPTRAGTAGLLYAVWLPLEPAAGEEEVVADILSSFHLRSAGTSGPEKGRGASARRWTDPTEGAFSVQVMPGWRASGGVVRPNSILTQAKVEVVSPRQDIYLYFGDTFPWFVEPNQFLGPGQVYRDPMGGTSPVWYYLPGSEFVVKYLLPRRYGQAEVVQQQALPQISSRLVRLGINDYHSGLVRYTFRRGGRGWQGSALCITERLMSGRFATWHVYRLALVEAVAGSLGEGEAALGRLVGSFRLNPGWLRAEAAKAGVNSQIISEMSQSISTSVRAAFENQQRTQEHALEKDARARRGIEEVSDPLTGEKFEVSSGSNYYWIDARGRIIGTQTDSIPDIDFRHLIILP